MLFAWKLASELWYRVWKIIDGGGLVTELYLTFVTPCTVAHQAPLSMGSSRQEYWCGLPLPSPGDLPNPEIEPTSPMSTALLADSLSAEPSGKPPGWWLHRNAHLIKINLCVQRICPIHYMHIMCPSKSPPKIIKL